MPFRSHARTRRIASQRTPLVAPKRRRPFSKLFQIASILTALCATDAMCQAIDTAVDVGGYRLHFHIVKGTGTPILFESGGGDDATVWRDILAPLADITNATLITYDRPGFGKSGLDARRHGIVNGVIDLEKGLKTLGYDGNVVLVAHSLGGFNAMLYASRHPETVKAAVLIDANLACFFTSEHMAAARKSNEEAKAKYKDTKPGLSYLFGDFSDTIGVMRRTDVPPGIPVTDIVSEKTPLTEAADVSRWRLCHQQFVSAAPARRGITAYGTGHYVFRENPPLVINAIVEAYADTLGEGRAFVLERSLSYNLEAANETKKKQVEYSHSESDLNSWGYQLLKQGEKEKALEVFKLNVGMNPDSANVYDSLAEAYESIGDKAQAIGNYKRSLELNPANSHATERLGVLQAPH